MTECHKELQGLMESSVSIITNDGRNIVGTLKGLDQKLNVILEECHERVFFERCGSREGSSRFIHCEGRQYCNRRTGGPRLGRES
mmetsp:Transcript_7741/g.12319  ORF Transcript_7741/g.12319 Transcript_7741/m.12319 type:complete len:85 (-) Transcript_7741:179-433(-)